MKHRLKQNEFHPLRDIEIKNRENRGKLTAIEPDHYLVQGMSRIENNHYTI